jgi:hypothetical protein
MSRDQVLGWKKFLDMDTNTQGHTPTYPPSASHSSGSSHRHSQPTSTGLPQPMTQGFQFDILEWHPNYRNCQAYFVNHAQYNPGVTSVAAFINIRLPCEWFPNPVFSFPTDSPHSNPMPTAGYPHHFHPSHHPARGTAPPYVSLIPYIRRLIVTGHDKEEVLQGFFGESWREGVGPLHEVERRNYMFMCKSVAWGEVKKFYDTPNDEGTPFVLPLQRVHIAEIHKGEKAWSEWLAMEDWMLGPRAPPEELGDYTRMAGRSGTADRDIPRGREDDMCQER